MAGQVHAMIDRIIAERSRGNATLATTTRTKLILKGIDPDKWSAASPDEPAVVARVRQVAAELNVTL
jgi:hypothetical protein